MWKHVQGSVQCTLNYWEQSGVMAFEFVPPHPFQVQIVSCLDRLGTSPPGNGGSASEPPGPWVVALMVRVVTEETVRLGLDGHIGEVLVVLADNAELAVRHSY
jgi:hypothetical protein